MIFFYLPGNFLDMMAHLFPTSSCILFIKSSSSFVHSECIIIESKWLWYLKWSPIFTFLDIVCQSFPTSCILQQVFWRYDSICLRLIVPLNTLEHYLLLLSMLSFQAFLIWLFAKIYYIKTKSPINNQSIYF